MWTPWRAPRRGGDDAADITRRFAALYSGTHDPADALFWLEHPDDEAPSGAASPTRPLVELRDALYRQDVTAADRRRYESAVAVADADRALAVAARDRSIAAATEERARRAQGERRLRVAALGSAALVFVGAVVVGGVVVGGVAVGSAGTGGGPTPSASASQWIGIDRFPDATSGTMTVRSSPTAAGEEGVASASSVSGVGIVQIQPEPVAGVKTITVAVTCAMPGTYSWIAAGVPNSNGISAALTRSGTRSCTGAASRVTKPLRGDLTLVQVTGPANEAFDASVEELR